MGEGRPELPQNRAFRAGGGVGSDLDHILTAKRHDRGRPSGPTSFPCQDPVTGIRHAFDLGMLSRHSSVGPQNR